MRNQFKILHVASFLGNIGDNASHMGFDAWLSKIAPSDVKRTKLEIRKSYNNYNADDKFFFDESFAKLANRYDLVVFGGGAFLSFWIENSVTGTTINMSEDVWGKIKTPVLLASIGCISNVDIPRGNMQKFGKFLDFLLARDKTAMALRNDGSREEIALHLGQKYVEKVPQVLDSAFFYDAPGDAYKALPKKFIAINITIEQLQMGGGHVSIDEAIYYAELQKVVRYVLEKTDYHIVFIPHLYNDVSAAMRAIDGVGDHKIREKVQIAPHVQGDEGANLLFSIYKKSSLALGMRFHANACAIAMNIPSIGLVAQMRVKDLYDSLGLSNRYVLLDQKFGDELIKKVSRALASGKTMTKKSQDKLRGEKAKTLAVYKDIFTNLGITR